jgi:galactokinase
VPVPSSAPERAQRLIAALELAEIRAGAAVPGAAPIAVARAPGRVNLIGEHTDYNDGFALPVAIDLEIWLAWRRRDEAFVDVTSRDLGETARFDVRGLDAAQATGTWRDYVAGVAWAAAQDRLPVRGFRGVLDSTLPIGAGLSSSAALEMATLLALLERAEEVPAEARARLGRRCENEYVGVPTGVMDQLASAAGRAGSALLLDCRSLEVRPVPLPPGIAIVACDTGSSRGLQASEYAARRADCEAGVAIVAKRAADISSLRDVTPELLERERDRLPELVYRRCRHVVEENARVLATAAALEEGDLDRVGQALAASHDSLRDLYDVVSPEQDAMVEIARGVPGVIAARMTGGGFGGCTVNLVRADAVPALREAVERCYPARTGLQPRVYETAAVDGAGAVDLGPG